MSLPNSRCTETLNCCICPLRKFGVTPLSANRAGPCFRFGDVVTMGKPCDVVVVGTSFPEKGMFTTKSYGGWRNWRILVPAFPCGKVEQPVAAADDGLLVEPIGEADVPLVSDERSSSRCAEAWPYGEEHVA